MNEPNWTMAQLVDLLSEIASAGWAIRTLMYGTHTGNPSEKPWRGPLACEVYVTDWRSGGPVSVADVNRLHEVVTRHHADLELSAFGGDGDGCVARVGIGEWGSRFLIDNHTAL